MSDPSQDTLVRTSARSANAGVHVRPRRPTMLATLDAAELAEPDPAVLGSAELMVLPPLSGPDAPTIAVVSRAAQRLADAGIATIGLVRLGYGGRPVATVREEILDWAQLPVVGVLLDESPNSGFQLGPIAVAIRTARRSGLSTVVLNPAGSVDPSYRALGVTICSFAGDWPAYTSWRGGGAFDGDAHFVFGVPGTELGAARELIAARGAGLALVSAGGWPYAAAGRPG